MYSEQDLKYAAEFRDEIHKEALAIVRKTRPNVTQVIDRHTLEDYFQENWEYPGRMYSIVAIPYGYKSRQALIDTIVRDTLSENPTESEPSYAKELRDMKKTEPNGQSEKEEYELLTDDTKKTSNKSEDPFYSLIAEYPYLVVDYFIVDCEQYCGYESHRKALKTAYCRICEKWEGNHEQAVGKRIRASELVSSDYQDGKLNYRKAFLYPPHENSYTGKDFVRVNNALFPSGTNELDVYEWTTDWSEYFDEGHEWWGTLCLTVYDKTLNRFAVIMASATD